MKPARDATGNDTLPAAEASRIDGHVTGWTTAAVLAVMWAGVPWAAPLAATAPLAWVLRRERSRPRTPLVTRWVGAVGIAGAVCIGLIGARAVRTVPFGPAASDDTRGWLEGAGAAPPAIWAMLAASAGFAVATVTTRGLLGCVVLSGVVLWAAATAGAVYARCSNLFEATVVALPVWTLLWVAGMALALGPLSAWSPSRRVGGAPFPRRVLLVATALVAAALLVRLLAAPMYTELARRMTAR
jgi:hypothetical protein